MAEASRPFQVFVKPIGAACNLRCSYCYYLEKAHLFPGSSAAMSNEVLERYISQHIKASPTNLIRFSWHGGEPTLLGVDYFQEIVHIQKRFNTSGRKILNGSGKKYKKCCLGK